MKGGKYLSMEKEDYIDYHEIIQCIVGALDAKDPYTANHSRQVGNMVQKVCQLTEIRGILGEEIHISAHLHDIGKIGVPDAILNKHSQLSENEWEIVRMHPSTGARILMGSPRLQGISQNVLRHHERYDGGGYPGGIKGEEIPIGARIIALCDSVDTMLTDRIYRKAFSMENCYEEIRLNLGKMYDPVIGKTVLEHFDEIVRIRTK